MPNVEFPEVKERMETKVCCAHNVTRGCPVNSKVDVVDLALQPLKALKLLMDGLALDGVSGLWLRSLLGPPRMMHLFPFDFVYLDEELRIVEGLELFPNAPFPRWELAAASALILPLRSLSSTGTQKGDRLVICLPEELESRVAEITVIADPRETIPPAIQPAESAKIPRPPISMPSPATPPAGGAGFDQRVQPRSSTVAPGANFTVSVATTWQVTSTTIPQAVLREADAEEPESTPAEIVQALSAMPKSALPATPADVANVRQIAEAAGSESEPSAKTQGSEKLLSSAADLAQNAQSHGEPELPDLLTAIAAAEAAETIACPPPNASEEDSTHERIARSREAWEKTQVRPQRVATSPAVRAKKRPAEPKKDPLGTRVIRWLNLEEPPPERRKIIRLRLEGLEAYDLNGDHNLRYEMRDICPSGFCLRADAEWQEGQLVSLVIEKKGAMEQDRHHSVRVRARVVRREEDGIGLEFVFSKGTEFHPWERVKTKRSDETEAEFILRELRFSNAFGFLRRLCPGAAEQVRHAFQERLSNKRVASTVDIVLLAEETLSRHGQLDLARAHTDMVMRIVESGSWIEDGWIRKLWAGLLVSSCSADGQDASNQPFIDLLAKLTPLHLRVLSFVCGKAAEAIAAGHSPSDFYLECTAEELMEVSDWHSFARIQQTVGHLSSYGLFAESARPSYVTLTDKSKMRIAPTALGLKMWARCNGQRV